MSQAVMEGADPSRHCKSLTPEEEAQLVERLYTESLARKKSTMEALDVRYYPVAPPHAISETTLQQSIQRQVDDEMQRRQQRRQEIDAMVAVSSLGYKDSKALTASKKTLTSEEVGLYVQRVYTEELERRRASKVKSERLYGFHPEDIKAAKMSKDALQASINRMSKPKKTEFTVAEINKVYGL
ncbi:hypothetical protein JKF63_01934 [Porcisia hertigi]|uniref:Uncharacterized protein n=1 Tax=Porcisia hertigi TaxID=2761500 RepID=A0A836HJW5_9TRYP|nr:hypothetical protein JKF63_01934 [Porcisia hertigi]